MMTNDTHHFRQKMIFIVINCRHLRINCLYETNNSIPDLNGQELFMIGME